MARMPLLAAAVAGGRRRLVDLSATAPSAGNWQLPQEQDSGGIPPWSSWPRDVKNQFLFGASFMAFIIVCVVVCFCRRDEDEEQDTSRFVHGPWSNNDDAEGVVSAPPSPPPLPQQHPPASWDGGAPRSNSGEGGIPPRRQRRRRRQPPTVAEEPAADVELAAMSAADVELALAAAMAMAALAGVELAPAPVPEPDVEIAPAPEPPAPTLKCTFSTADGWTEGTCAVCQSDLEDGEKVRVLTACMHCFHATCVERWLRQNATCPICRAPAMAIPARGRRRQRPGDPNLSLA